MLRIDVVELGRRDYEIMAAARSVPRSEPAKSYDFLPSANPRLLDRSTNHLTKMIKMIPNPRLINLDHLSPRA